MIDKYLYTLETLLMLYLGGKEISDTLFEEEHYLWNSMTDEERKFIGTFTRIIVDIIKYDKYKECTDV
jgi:hypothetical protein